MFRPRLRRSGAVLLTSFLLGACQAQDDDPGPLVPPASQASQAQTGTAPAGAEEPTQAPAPPSLEIPKPDMEFSGPSEPPAGLSGDVPIFPNATTIGSMTSATRGTIVNLNSPESADAIFAWYQQELPKRGWTLDKQSGTTFSHLVTATRDTRKATVLIKRGPNGTAILVTVAQAGGG